MLSGDERFTDEELQRYADEAARVFFAAYGLAPAARKAPSRKSKTAGSGKYMVRLGRSLNPGRRIALCWR